eukprot:m.145510 g.145510  ORF g.145510 m.145510 type:complete len:109 (-) comp30444_c0_seq2:142-468(-)
MVHIPWANRVLAFLVSFRTFYLFFKFNQKPPPAACSEISSLLQARDVLNIPCSKRFQEQEKKVPFTKQSPNIMLDFPEFLFFHQRCKHKYLSKKRLPIKVFLQRLLQL